MADALKTPTSARHSIECSAPATGEALGRVSVTPTEWLPTLVARGRDAHRVWRRTSFAERSRVLGVLLDHLLGRADEICGWITRDAGKTHEHAILGEVWPVAEKIRWTRRHAERHLRAESVSPGLFVHKRARIEYEPLGVIGVISPWNYPLQNMLGPAIPALAAGNAVVIKPSEWVAWSSARIQGFIDDALEAAGAPRGLVQTVQGFAETGAALIGAGVDKVVFTGSHENGKKVLATAASTLTPCILELGGKDPLIVCDDAHLEQAAHSAMAGAFINCGQNCLATERVLVFDGIYEAFEARVVELTRALRQGPPDAGRVDLGAILSPLQLDRVEALVDDAVRAGARVLVGGQRALAETGQFFAPTVLADVTPDMRIAREETFGPVMVLMRVADEREAVAVANGTPFGLSATVASKSAARCRRIAAQLKAGSTAWNDFGLTYMAMELPFGGVAGSGFGRLNGRDGLRAMCNQKAVMEDRLPFKFPAKVFPAGPRTYPGTRETLRLLYGRDLRAKVDAVKALLRGE